MLPSAPLSLPICTLPGASGCSLHPASNPCTTNNMLHLVLYQYPQQDSLDLSSDLSPAGRQGYCAAQTTSGLSTCARPSASTSPARPAALSSLAMMCPAMWLAQSTPCMAPAWCPSSSPDARLLTMPPADCAPVFLNPGMAQPHCQQPSVRLTSVS